VVCPPALRRGRRHGDVGCRRPLVVTDPYMVSSGKVATLGAALEEQGASYGVFSDTVPEPSTADVDGTLAAFQSGNHDGLIALGGGSPMDIAKVAGILAANGGHCRDYKFPSVVPAPGPPLVAIPTTAGTGSECTKVAVITDVQTQEKMMMAHPYLMPSGAIVDYQLSMTCPPRLTADNAIDALTHAIEAYVSRKQNPMSDAIALEAIRKLAPNLRRVWKEPGNEQGREELMYAASLAGLAFSNSSVALVHGMSRPIGAHFHVPHGMSNAMLLPAITEFSVSAAAGRYADCARAMGLVSVETSEKEACEVLVAELRALNRELEVPTLKQFGAEPARFDSLLSTMAQQALASGSPGNNPRTPSEAEIVDLYKQVFDMTY